MAILINKKYPDFQIELKKDKRHLLKNINKFMKGKFNCDDQVCWLKTTDLIKALDNDDINFFTFRPDGPKNKDWLSTSNINNVMLQYENKYPNFKFFDASSI